MISKGRLWVLLLLPLFLWGEKERVLSPLSDAEADDLVEREMEARLSREVARRHALRSEAASSVVRSPVSDSSGRNFVIRRIATPAGSVLRTSPATSPRPAAEKDSMPVHPFPYRQIRLSATVFDRTLSEVVYRCEDGRRLRIVSNIDFNLLAGMGRFTDETAHWSLVMTVSNVDSEEEKRRERQAAEFGSTYVAREGPEPSLFETPDPGYVVFAESEEAVPEKLFEELDALHRHYLENEDRLRVLFHNREAKRAALERWREKNPPAAQDTIINFWPIQSNEPERKN